MNKIYIFKSDQFEKEPPALEAWQGIERVTPRESGVQLGKEHMSFYSLVECFL